MKPKIIKQNVGIDQSKNDFKVCLQQLNTNQERKIKKSSSFKNSLSGFKSFVSWLEKSIDSDTVLRVTIEATGVYYEQLVHYLERSYKISH